jgi:hypothetical protein
MKKFFSSFPKIALASISALLCSGLLASALTVWTSGQGDVAIPGLTTTTIDNMAIGGTTRASGKFTTLDANGQITSSTGLPVINSGDCGATTNGAIVAGSTNQSGQLTIGAAATTTCKVTFSAALAAAPKFCSVFPMNATGAATGTTVARVGAPTTTDFTITGSALANANYGFLCL